MKIDRLIGIVVYLLNHGRTSAQKLAEEFEVWGDSFLWKQGQDCRAVGDKGAHSKDLQRNTDGI